MVDLQTCAPHPALRRYVRRYVQRRLAADAELQEPVTARLGALFEFHFAGLYRIPICGTDRFEACAPMLAVGPITYRRVQLQADGYVDALTVMFQPCGLYELFGIPTHLLAEHATEAHSLLGASISRLYARLGEAADFGQRVQLLDSFLLRQPRRQRDGTAPRWDRAFAWLAQDRGPHTMRQVAEILHTNVRMLERRSLEFAGMTPLSLVRVARFAHALRLQRRGQVHGAMNWTEIAHAAGYYDQAHLIREFRVLGGATPTRLTDQLEPHHGASLQLEPAARSFPLSVQPHKQA